MDWIEAREEERRYTAVQQLSNFTIQYSNLLYCMEGIMEGSMENSMKTSIAPA